jgi:hypothetical protein
MNAALLAVARRVAHHLDVTLSLSEAGSGALHESEAWSETCEADANHWFTSRSEAGSGEHWYSWSESGATDYAAGGALDTDASDMDAGHYGKAIQFTFSGLFARDVQ